MITPDQVIYLDNNATTQLDPAVLEEMQPFVTQFFGNPSSGYQFGAQVRKAIDCARDRVAGLLGCEPNEIIFTSCGTESNNAAINSALQIDPSRKHVVTTAVEHSAVLRHCQILGNRGYDVTFLKVNRDGDIDLAEVERAIRPDTAIVSAMWANNETGVLFPIDALAQICKEKRVLFHTDAVQAVGKVPVRLRDAGIHFLSLSAHKFHGPKGVGALYANRRVRFRPLIFGGGQENGRRAGTENAASIVGLGKAAECAGEFLPDEETRVRAIRDRFEGKLLKTINSTSINGHGTRRLPNTSSVSFDGIDASAALLLLDRHRLCCSAGSACRTGSTESSHVLRAMQRSAEEARATLRFSFGRFNSDAEVDKTCAIILAMVDKLRQLSAGRTPDKKAALQTSG
jgi:cysteine desulfurase